MWYSVRARTTNIGSLAGPVPTLVLKVRKLVQLRVNQWAGARESFSRGTAIDFTPVQK